MDVSGVKGCFVCALGKQCGISAGSGDAMGTVMSLGPVP